MEFSSQNIGTGTIVLSFLLIAVGFTLLMALPALLRMIQKRTEVQSDYGDIARELCDAIRERYQSPAIPFSLKMGIAGFLQSKIGGTPYLPHDMPWPCSRDGVPLSLLAQIDCRKLRRLPDFPNVGLLQFYINEYDAEGLYGLPVDDTGEASDFCVLYHETIDPSVTAEEVEAKRPLPPHGRERVSPVLCLCRISFGRQRMMCLCGADRRFQALLLRRWNRRVSGKKLKKIEQLYTLLAADGVTDDISEEQPPALRPFHCVGGYPTFFRTDPRSERVDIDRDVLLLQLDSDGKGDIPYVLWGDAGIGQFFIHSSDLKARDFSHVRFYWDCEPESE